MAKPVKKTPTRKPKLVAVPETHDDAHETMFRDARAFAALRAVESVTSKIRGVLAQKDSEVKAALKALAAEYLNTLDTGIETEGELDDETAAEMFRRCCQAKSEHGKVKAAGDVEKSVINSKIGRLLDAGHEIRAIYRGSTASQPSLYGGGKTVPGMAWASDEMLSTLLAALVVLEREGAIDEAQGLLLDDIGGVGLSEFDLGLKAEVAIEGQGVEGEPDSDDDDDDSFPSR